MPQAIRSVHFWFGLGLMVCFLPGVTGYSVLTGWPYLAVTLPFALFRRTQFTIIHALLLAFVGWVLLSLAWTDNLYDGVGAVAIWIILAMGFYYGTVCGDNARFVYLGICVGATLSVLVCISQSFGYEPIYSDGDYRTNVTGLFVNSTVFGSILALSLVLAVFQGFWWYIPVGSLGLLLSGSRGPAIALAMAVLVGVWNWSRGLALILAIPALLFCVGVWLNKPTGNVSSLQVRSAYWADTIEALTVRGHGVGSFFQLYPEFAKRTDVVKARPEHPYSDILEILFEFGIASLLLWSALILAWEVPLETERLLLLAFAILSLTYFPLAIPPAAFLVAFAAGRLAWGRSLVRSGVRPRGSFKPYWIGER